MSLQSMTGFGAAETTAHGWTMKVECRGVNHRGLDVRVWSPRDWPWVEAFVIDTARALLHRGRVDVRVDVVADTDGTAATYIDPVRFAAVARELTAAAAGSRLDPPTTADVLTFDDVRSSVAAQTVPTDHASFQAAIVEAMTALARSRAQEGLRLRSTMDELANEVERRVRAIDSAAGAVADEYRTRLEQRVRDALARFEVRELDERSVLQEVALYADRSDISEELQRATSHIQKLREVFDANGTVGKQIDFYLQELFREANTTGSKSGSLAITEHVIAMKTAIEKMREQAANIE